MSATPDSSHGWSPTPADLTLSPGHIDVWRCPTRLTPEAIAGLAATLSDEERTKAERLRDPDKQVQSIVARGVLRRVLGLVLRCEPRDLRFATGLYGKPYLIGRPNGAVPGFNVSHTAGWVLVAVTPNGEVGVDVERVRTDFAWQGIARQFFSTEEAAALLAMPIAAGRRAFFESWVRKEALLKMLGIGMTGGVAADVGGEVADLDLGPDYAAAVASDRSMTVRQWRL